MKCFWFALCVTAAAPEPAPAQRQADRPPNVLFLLADDLGWADVAFNNPETFYETPHLDRLAAEGLRFTQAYAASPVCSPTRASLLTGRTPARLGTTNYFGAPQPDVILASAENGDTSLERFRNLPLLPAAYEDRLALEEITLAEVLREAGYATYFAGKWHLGGEGFSPLEQGFDVNVAGDSRGGPYGPGRYFHPFGMPNLASQPGDHLPARLAQETVAFLREHKDQRWLAWLSFYSVHTPLMGREDLVERYRAKRKALDRAPIWGQEGERRVRLSQEHAVYAAMVHALDEAVGIVLEALDELGLTDDTLVVFFSDNGGLSTSEGRPTSNWPLRTGKGWLYEGGLREPCVVRWPGKVEAGGSCDTPILSTDFMPTLLAATGHALPEVELDGASFLDLLTGEGGLGARTLHWHYPHWGNQGGFPGGAIRSGDWKLVERFTDGSVELYDLAVDIGEAGDQAGEKPELAARLRAELQSWRESVGARLPRPNPLVSGAPGAPGEAR